MFEHVPNMRGLRREWLAARLFVLFGAIFLAGICVVLVFGNDTGLKPAPAAVADPGAHEAQISLCKAVLKTTQDYGIVPSFATLTGGIVQSAAVEGRYTCLVGTPAGQYQVTADLLCRDLNNSRCFNLFNVTLNATNVLYQRR